MAELLELPFKPLNGKPPTTVLHRLLDAILAAGDTRLVLTLKEQKRKRSSSQNRYYFGVLVRDITKAFREAGNDMDELEVHEYLKNEVGKLSRIAVLPDGEVVKIPGSSKRLTTVEFEAYTEKVRVWASSMGLPLPLPNEELS